jgi:hypothetical protein
MLFDFPRDGKIAVRQRRPVWCILPLSDQGGHRSFQELIMPMVS